jgi:hypothetical protein
MRLLFPILVLALLAPVLASQAVITSVFKPPVTGKVVKVDVQGRLEVAVEGSEVPERIPLDEIEEVNFGQQGDERKPADAPLRVYLVNGDVLYGTPDVSPDGDEESFVLRGKRFTDIRIRNDAVSRIEYVANVQPNTLPELAADEKVDVVHWPPWAKPRPRLTAALSWYASPKMACGCTTPPSTATSMKG